MKRLLDILIIVIFGPLLITLLIILYFLVSLNLGRPVFFRQNRPGKDGRIFGLIKFRTMTNERDANGNLLLDQDRLTKFGAWLRSSSLDELPEIINVLKGEMSLVGPRPLLVKYMELYSAEQARRHEVRPGITGWAQVKGRNSLSWEEKFKLDVEYVDKHDLLMDLKILWMTLFAVIFRRGISADQHATMPEFEGNKNKG